MRVGTLVLKTVGALMVAVSFIVAARWGFVVVACGFGALTHPRFLPLGPFGLVALFLGHLLLICPLTRLYPHRTVPHGPAC